MVLKLQFGGGSLTQTVRCDMVIKIHKQLEVVKVCFFILLALIIAISIAYIFGNWLGPVDNQNFLGLNK